MKNIALFNETFNVSATATYYLSLNLASEYYSYCIIDSIRSKYTALKHENFNDKIKNSSFADKVKYMLKNDVFLNKNYKRIDFAFVSVKSTLIPHTLFQKESLKDYFSFNQKLDEYEEIHFNKLNITEANNIFTIPSEVTTLMVNQFPEIKFFHQTTSLIQNTLSYVNGKKYKGIFIQIDVKPDFFDIEVVISGKLIMSNSIHYREDNDFIYYILNIVKQLNLKTEIIELSFSGDIDDKSEKYKLAKHFFSHTRFAKVRGRIQYNFKDIPEHKFANLLNLHECE